MGQDLTLICLMGMIITGVVGIVSIFCGGYLRLLKDRDRIEWETGRSEAKEPEAKPRGKATTRRVGGQ